MKKNKKGPDTEDLIMAGTYAAPNSLLTGDAVSGTEMTGLIPSIPLSDFESDSYEDIEDYKA